MGGFANRGERVVVFGLVSKKGSGSGGSVEVGSTRCRGTFVARCRERGIRSGEGREEIHLSGRVTGTGEVLTRYTSLQRRQLFVGS